MVPSAAPSTRTSPAIAETPVLSSTAAARSISSSARVQAYRVGPGQRDERTHIERGPGDLESVGAGILPERHSAGSIERHHIGSDEEGIEQNGSRVGTKREMQLVEAHVAHATDRIDRAGDRRESGGVAGEVQGE